MKILKIIHGYPPGYNAGSEVYSQSICEELSKKHEVFVFTREEDPYHPDFSIREEKVSRSLSLFLANMARDKDGYRHRQLDTNFETIVDKIKPHVAHIGHLNHLSTGIVDVLKKRNIPIVFTLHDFWLMCPRGQFLQRNFGNERIWQRCDKQENRKCAEKCYSSYFSSTGDRQDIDFWTAWINKRMKETRSIIDKADVFIAPSKYLQDRFIKKFNVPASKIGYLDYGFPTHYLKPSISKPKREHFTFGYIGTHIPSKGIHLLIEAFGKLKGNVRLLIWGAKDQQSTRALVKMAEAAQLPIEFRGGYQNKDIAEEVFTQVDCIVVPSIWSENSPLVIHEAQACKVPVITADCGGMKEYVHNNVNGLLFKHRDSNDLAEKMQWAIGHPVEMERLGERGYLYHPEGEVPGIAEHCLELEKIYGSLISKNDHELWRITIDTNPEDCNLSCIMCEEHSPFSKYIDELYKETGTRKRRMPVEWLDKIFAQAKQLGVKEVIPSTMGEPLIYKAIEKIYTLAKQNDILINLTTNGTFPRKTVKEWAEIIIPQTSDVKISWNGATKETAEKIMKGLDFEKVLENAREFVEWRDEHYSQTGKYCRITFQLTFMQNNMHELADIIKLAASLNIDRVKGHHLWAHFEEIKDLSMRSNENPIIKWNCYVAEARKAAEAHRRPNGDKVLLENIYPIPLAGRKEVPAEYVCPFLGKELWISATGKISPCCAPDKQRDRLGDFGNIQRVSIGEVLNGPAYRELVANYRDKELCKTCNMRKPQ
jgi:glycosyltransferase involved in cell wall biosynthesis/MoaA/NifB/PqqE/SkfB family radical SAM enzyme